MISRRGFLTGVLGLAATTLIVPPTLAENVEDVRRYWSLDRTMVRPHYGWDFFIEGPACTGGAFYQAVATHRDGTTITDRLDISALLAEDRNSRGVMTFFRGTAAEEAFRTKVTRSYELRLIAPVTSVGRTEVRPDA